MKEQIKTTRYACLRIELCDYIWSVEDERDYDLDYIDYLLEELDLLKPSSVFPMNHPREDGTEQKTGE